MRHLDDDMDNSAIDNVEENTPDVSDQKGSEDSVQMGILWNCSVTDAQIGGGLTMLIDDRSGKLLSFSFTRNQDDSAMEDDESEKEKYVEVIQEPSDSRRKDGNFLREILRIQA